MSEDFRAPDVDEREVRTRLAAALRAGLESGAGARTPGATAALVRDSLAHMWYLGGEVAS